MSSHFRLKVNRSVRVSLANQIHAGIRDAIHSGRLKGGARLPSWRDLAAQLGVARGTVRSAYERLTDEQLILGQGAAGTYVSQALAVQARGGRMTETSLSADPFYSDPERPPLPFQLGVPSQDAFPFAVWTRALTKAARDLAMAPVNYPDPRGRLELRQEIASFLGLIRGLHCEPSQVFVTAGFTGALGFVLQALRPSGEAWVEEPGFPPTREALALAGLTAVPVPVDAEGLSVAEGVRRAPNACLALVTPGQQAPLGMTLSLPRRRALLEWARETQAWIIEDDYLSELQLEGRAAPALASLEPAGRVLHVGTFSKTLSPALRLGFLVVPPSLVTRFEQVAARLAPAPATASQQAVTVFMAEGHLLRHLRRMKRLYRARRDALLERLRAAVGDGFEVHEAGGLAVRLSLPEGVDDRALAVKALPLGLAPFPLSPWYAEPPHRTGLLLGVTNVLEHRLASDCDRLLALLPRPKRRSPR